MALKVKTARTLRPISVMEAKTHLRVIGTEEDLYIESLIDAVTGAAEAITRRTLLTTTYQYYLDTFPCQTLYLPAPPVQSVTSVKYYDSAGLQQTLGSANYQVDVISEPTRLVPSLGLVWPTTYAEKLNAVEVEYVAGWTAATAIPRALRQAMLYHLTHLFDTREPFVVGTIVAAIPFTLLNLYAPYRVHTFY